MLWRRSIAPHAVDGQGCISTHCLKKKGRRARVVHPLIKGRRSAVVSVMGSCRGIANMGAADASRRFAYCGLVVGTLPSRRLAAMSLYWQHLATPDKVDELFATYLRTSSVLTSADVGRKSTICQLYSANFCQITSFRRSKKITSFRPSEARGEISAVAPIQKPFVLLCHCEEAKRRGNPPKGFLSSEAIYGKKASWLMQYTAAINPITLNVPPQHRYPDRPPPARTKKYAQ